MKESAAFEPQFEVKTTCFPSGDQIGYCSFDPGVLVMFTIAGDGIYPKTSVSPVRMLVVSSWVLAGIEVI